MIQNIGAEPAGDWTSTGSRLTTVGLFAPSIDCFCCWLFANSVRKSTIPSSNNKNNKKATGKVNGAGLTRGWYWTGRGSEMFENFILRPPQFSELAHLWKATFIWPGQNLTFGVSAKSEKDKGDPCLSFRGSEMFENFILRPPNFRNLHIPPV